MKSLYFFIAVLLIVFAGCRSEKKELIEGYSHAPEGYYYRLLAFNDNTQKPAKGSVLWLDAVFKNLNDSVFWDSKHDASARFLIRLDDTAGIYRHLYNLSEGDSMSFYFRPKDFFRLYFRTDSLPFFCKNDTLVKADLKLRKIMGEDDLLKLKNDLASNESKEIEAFMRANDGKEFYKDSVGVIWLEHLKNNQEQVIVGTIVSISYKGFFLDGKMIDHSVGNFTFTYGTPDQLLKGLNFVIKKMRKGEYAKIILPSWLAYGESGSSNGAVPPFTPLLYEIKIKD